MCVSVCNEKGRCGKMGSTTLIVDEGRRIGERCERECEGECEINEDEREKESAR